MNVASNKLSSKVPFLFRDKVPAVRSGTSKIIAIRCALSGVLEISVEGKVSMNQFLRGENIWPHTFQIIRVKDGEPYNKIFPPRKTEW